MLKRCTIKHNHVGLVFRDGKYAETLSAGNHFLWGAHELQEQAITSFPAQLTNLDRLYLENKDALSEHLQFVQTSGEELALAQKGTQFLLIKPLQVCAFWRDIEPLVVDKIGIPKDLLLPASWIQKLEHTTALPWVKFITIAAGQFGLLLRDGKILVTLEAGQHAYFDIYPKTELQIYATNRAIGKLELIEEFKAHCAVNVDHSAAGALQILRVAANELVVLKDAGGPVDMCASGNEYLIPTSLGVERISLAETPLPLPDWLMQALRNTGDAPSSRSAHFANLLRKNSTSWEVPADHCGVLYVDGVMGPQLTRV